MEGYDLDVPDTGVDNTYNSSLPTSKCGRVKQNVGEGRLSLESPRCMCHPGASGLGAIRCLFADEEQLKYPIEQQSSELLLFNIPSGLHSSRIGPSIYIQQTIFKSDLHSQKCATTSVSYGDLKKKKKGKGKEKDKRDKPLRGAARSTRSQAPQR